MPQASTIFLIAIGIPYLVAGTVQTLSLKWADKISAPDRFLGGLDDFLQFRVYYTFAHPFAQAFFMFCSETTCLVAFLASLVYKKYIAKQQREGCAPGELVAGQDYSLPCNPCVWLLPAGADFLASIIQNVGMVLTYASVYQMLRGATVFWIAVISYYWLGRRFNKVEWWGMGTVVLGLSFVGLSSILQNPRTIVSSDEEEELHKNVLIGNLLIISAQVLHAYQGVCEERLVRLYRIPPLQMVGMEGLYGMAMSISLLAFLQLVPMVRGGDHVRLIEEINPHTGASLLYTNVTWYSSRVKELDGGKRLPYDDVVLAFDQIRQDWRCVVFLLLYIPAGFLYNACQMNIIKYISAAATVMLGSLRNVTVWAVCLMIPSVFNEHFNIVQFIGFLLLLAGNVLFQRVWITNFDEVLPAKVIAVCPWAFLDKRETPEDADTSLTAKPAGENIQEKAPQP